MMQKLRSWLIRHRDQTAVSYNRFGRPGEEEDDKPPPSTIYVAPFNDNAQQFMVFRSCHAQRASIYFACFGMAMVILVFVSLFFEFDWYQHQRGVDFGALLGLLLFLAIGVLAHYYVLFGIKRQQSRYLLPFIALYSVLCICELFMCFALLFKTVDPGPHFQVHIVSSGGGRDDQQQRQALKVSHPPFMWLLLGQMVVLCIQSVMLTGVLKCRYFLSQKEQHEMAMKVAEKSRTEFPSIQIVVAAPNGLSAGASLPTSFAPQQHDEEEGGSQPNSDRSEETTATASSSPFGQQPRNGGGK